MDFDDPPAAGSASSSPNALKKTASQSPSPSAGGEIPGLPDTEFEMEMDDIDSSLDVTPISVTRDAEKLDSVSEPVMRVTVDSIGPNVEGAPGSRNANMSRATDIVATALSEAGRDEPALGAVVPSQGESSGLNQAEAIRSSLERKDSASAMSNHSSPLSSIPNLPMEDFGSDHSPVPPFGSSQSPDTRAESSSTSSRRARKLPKPNAVKAMSTVPKVTRSSAAKERPALRSQTEGVSAKRTRDERDKNVRVEKVPRPRKKRVVKESDEDSLDDDAAGEPLKTVEEAGVDEKPAETGRRKVAPKPVRARSKAMKKVKQLSDAQIRENNKGKTSEMQPGTCMRARYAKWGKCTQCTSKSGGDTCRFRDFRQFPIDPMTGEINGPGFFESTELPEEPESFPLDFNVPLQEEHLRSVEESSAPILLPIITREIRHVVKTKAIKRAVDPAADRSFCDFCSCTIFAGYFFCKTCGRDYCLSCERYFSEAAETMDQSPWHLVAAARTRLLKCVPPPDSQENKAGPSNRKEQPPTWHFRGQLQPVSSLTEAELKSHWLALAEFVVKGEEKKSDWSTLLGYAEDNSAKLAEEIETFRSEYKPPATAEGQTAPTPVDFASLYTKFTRPGVPLPADAAGLREQSHPFMRISSPDKLDDATFDQIWARGEPIVVDGVRENFKMHWTPDQMIAEFGKEKCEIGDCEKEGSRKSTIREFFEAFKEPKRKGKEVFKLQDWPKKEGFQKKHPVLFDDFCGALPVPDFTLQNGVRNLFSHFPRGPTRPDLGPKMYNAFAGKETKGGHGSTRLHMDVADAINIMLYASKTDSSPPETDPYPVASSSTPTEPALPTEKDAMEDLQSEAGPSILSTRETRTKSRSLSTKSATRPSTRAGKQAETEPQQLTDNEIEAEAAAEAKADGQHPGCAVWDIYRAEDADKLRGFLAKKYAKSKIDFTDPIHSQMFYLDSALRQELYKSTKVTSFRIYQYPGQAVFIPAGCAHQVCNLADCIKIAMDFVSPHNVSRCQQLTQDFRKENFVKVWKDDVLQLYNILWFAWLSARETRERQQEAAESDEVDRLNTMTTLAELDTAQPSTLGRGLVSSVRDDPSSSLRLDTLPLPPILASATAEPHPPSPSSPPVAKLDTAKALVARLFDAAISAPDTDPPEEAKPPPPAAPAGWGRSAPNSRAGGSGANGTANSMRKRTRASLLAEGDREGTPLMTVASVRALGASGKRITRASDAFRDGDLPMGYAIDLIQADMGLGGDMDEELDED